MTFDFDKLRREAMSFQMSIARIEAIRQVLINGNIPPDELTAYGLLEFGCNLYSYVGVSKEELAARLRLMADNLENDAPVYTVEKINDRQ